MRMVEVDFDTFKRQLNRSATDGTRIEKTEKARWSAYLKEHNVHEAAAMVHGKSYSPSVKPVIIADGGQWDGFYVYSDSDVIALRFQLQ